MKIEDIKIGKWYYWEGSWTTRDHLGKVLEVSPPEYCMAELSNGEIRDRVLRQNIIRLATDKELEKAGIIKRDKQMKKFKIGDWLYADCNNSYALCKYNGMNADGINIKATNCTHYLNGSIYSNESSNMYTELSRCRLATDKEIKEHLIKEAIRRGYTEDAIADSLGGNINQRVGPIEWLYNLEFDILRSHGNCLVYEKGKWAEIKSKGSKQMEKFSVKLSDNMQLRAAQSRLLQETAFEANYRWSSGDKEVRNLDAAYLGFNPGEYKITWHNSDVSDFPVLSIEEALERLQKPQFKVEDWIYVEKSNNRDFDGFIGQVTKLFYEDGTLMLSTEKNCFQPGKNDVIRLATKEEIKEATSFRKGQWVTTLPGYYTGYSSEAGAGYKPNYTFQIDKVGVSGRGNVLFPKDKDGVYSNYVRLATSEEIEACSVISLGNHKVEFRGNRIIAGCVSKTVDEVKRLENIMVEFDLGSIVHSDGTIVTRSQVREIRRRAEQ